MEQVVLGRPTVELIPSKMPDKRVITSLDPAPTESADADEESPFTLKGSEVFSGNPRAMFTGIILGALLISAGGVAYVKHERKTRLDMQVPRSFTPAKNKTITAPPGDTAPAPVVVDIRDSIHVSAIALGHPRLAVINGRAVAEGDWLTVHTPTRAVTVKLRVLKIADGAIDLTDGTQTIRAQLDIPSLTPREQK
jgi:hypothetical protein